MLSNSNHVHGLYHRAWLSLVSSVSTGARILNQYSYKDRDQIP